MQCQVRELVAKHHGRIAGIAARAAALHHHTLLVGKGDRGAPLGRSGADPGAKARGIGSDSDQDASLWARKAGKGIAGLGSAEQCAGEALVLALRDDREAAGVETQGSGLRLNANRQRECGDEQRNEERSEER